MYFKEIFEYFNNPIFIVLFVISMVLIAIVIALNENEKEENKLNNNICPICNTCFSLEESDFKIEDEEKVSYKCNHCGFNKTISKEKV